MCIFVLSSKTNDTINMKYPAQQFDKLTKALPVLLDSYGITTEQARDLTVGQLHTVHCRVFQQKNYTDDNANVKFIDGQRLFPIDEAFKLYPDGCNDDHIETAMKAAIKQLV